MRLGRYAPGRLVTPSAEPVAWTPEGRDPHGNPTASILCADAVEVRFSKPPGGSHFQVVVRGKLLDGVGPEWAITVPAERMGMLSIPQGFAADQSIMGAIYRLPSPRSLRIRAVEPLELPGLTFRVELI